MDLSKWPGNLEPETEENAKKVSVTIDIDQELWGQVKEAALKSKWIPEDYYINDWVADICHFLINGYNDINKKD